MGYDQNVKRITEMLMSYHLVKSDSPNPNNSHYSKSGGRNDSHHLIGMAGEWVLLNIQFQATNKVQWVFF